MNLERLSVFGRCRHCGVQGATGIDHEQVACREPSRQISEAGVLDRIGLDIRDEQSHLIAPEATRLRRFGPLSRSADSSKPAIRSNVNDTCLRSLVARVALRQILD